MMQTYAYKLNARNTPGFYTEARLKLIYAAVLKYYIRSNNII